MAGRVLISVLFFLGLIEFGNTQLVDLENLEDSPFYRQELPKEVRNTNQSKSLFFEIRTQDFRVKN